MDKQQPAQEQLKEFWGWCGVMHKFGGEWWYDRYKMTNSWYETSDGKKYFDYPPLDLNNLFKYAVPKLAGNWQLHIDYGVALYDVTLIECNDSVVHKAINTVSSDLSEALFGAIWEVIHG